MKNEPVMTLIVALIAAAGGLLAAFGVDVTAEQITALSTFAVAAVGLGLWVRSRVTPVAKTVEGRLSRLQDERGEISRDLILGILIAAVAVLLIVVFAA